MVQGYYADMGKLFEDLIEYTSGLEPFIPGSSLRAERAAESKTPAAHWRGEYLSGGDVLVL